MLTDLPMVCTVRSMAHEDATSEHGERLLGPSEDPTCPEQLPRALSSRIEVGDLKGALALYDPEATLAPESGELLRGKRRIRSTLRDLMALRPAFIVEPRKVIEAGSTALLIVGWRMTGVSADGEPVFWSGTGANIVRRGEDGVWRLLVDNPNGLWT